jgi:hypothetical protein
MNIPGTILKIKNTLSGSAISTGRERSFFRLKEANGKAVSTYREDCTRCGGFWKHVIISNRQVNA